MTIEARLKNGDIHTLDFDKSKEDFFDIIRFSRDNFIQDTNKSYIIISSIMSFKIIGEQDGKKA